jgi:hypothetical protein
MNFTQAVEALDNGQKVRLPEWRGYWFKSEDGEYSALTKDGDIVKSWTQDKGLKDRTDWEIANGLDFGWAICALKAGKLVTRAGWNGKLMFVFIRPSDEIPAQVVIENVKSLPESVKNHFDQKFKGDYIGASSGQPFKIKFTPYFCMKNAQGDIMNGWIPTQTDCLAEDWQLFEV